MHAHEHGHVLIAAGRRHAAEQLFEALGLVDILRAMKRCEQIVSGRHLQPLHHGAGLDRLLEGGQHLEDRVACHENPLALDAFANQVVLAALVYGISTVLE